MATILPRRRAVLEEMLFRGVTLRGFLRRYSRTFAIRWSAALFGIAHLNLYQFMTALAIGIVGAGSTSGYRILRVARGPSAGANGGARRGVYGRRVRGRDHRRPDSAEAARRQASQRGHSGSLLTGTPA